MRQGWAPPPWWHCSCDCRAGGCVQVLQPQLAVLCCIWRPVRLTWQLPTLPHPCHLPLCSHLPQFRARLWLFVSFLIAAGAVAGSVAVLVSASQQPDLAGIGVVSCCPLRPAACRRRWLLLLFMCCRSGSLPWPADLPC